MFVNKIKKVSSYVRLDVLAVRGVVPSDISVPVSSAVSCRCVVFVCFGVIVVFISERHVEIAVFEGVFVGWCSCIKGFLIRR